MAAISAGSVSQDPERCRKTGIPGEIEFQTKRTIAIEQMRQALEQKVPVGVVLADAAYGNSTQFRAGVNEFGLRPNHILKNGS